MKIDLSSAARCCARCCCKLLPNTVAMMKVEKKRLQEEDPFAFDFWTPDADAWP